MDIRHLLRSPSPESRRSQSVADAASGNVNAPVALGVLSRTVFRSPIVKWILPGRIRDIIYNDVIFVGEDFIELKEVQLDDRLRHRALRTDFGCGIYAARVLGPRPDSKAIQDAGDRLIRGIRRPSDELSPQILLLTLRTSEMVFVTASTDSRGFTTFLTHSHPLPVFPASPLQQPGHLMAVDPNSRAVAIAAVRDFVVLAKLKPIKDHHSLDELLDDTLVYDAETTILRMEFLYPSTADSSQVYLLLLGDDGILILNWDNDMPLTSDAVHTTQYRFGPEFHTPNLIVPLQTPGSFLMVTESGFAIFNDAHIGSLRTCHWHPRTPDDDPPRFPGLSARAPLWTNWARPARHHQYFHEDIYLAREDGIIWLLRVLEDSGTLSISDQTTAGVLKSSIGTAFALVDSHIENPDTLLSGGDLCDGGVYSLGQSYVFSQMGVDSRVTVMWPDLKEIIGNWAPFTDVAVVDDPSSQRRQYGQEHAAISRQRPQVYVTTGKGPNGAISELRYGLRLSVPEPIVLDEIENASHIWPLQSMDCIVLSFPEHSSILYGISGRDPQHVELGAERTLALAMLERQMSDDDHVPIIDTIGVTLQITTSSVQLLRLDSLEKDVKYGPSWFTPGITVAAIEPLDFLIISITRERPANLVQLKKLAITDGQWQLLNVGQPILFDEEPSCVNFFRDQSQHADVELSETENNFAILGTESGSFHILKADAELGLELLLSHSLGPTAGLELAAACESVHVIVDQNSSTSTGSHSNLLALCGMRDGVLHAVELRSGHADENFRLGGHKVLAIGETPVRAVPDILNPGCALIHCDTQVLYLYCREFLVDQIRVASVWFTNLVNRALTNSPILDICQIPTLSTASGSLCRVACITRTALLIGQLDDYQKPLPRPLRVPGTPSRVIYLTDHRTAVVASTIIMVETHPVPKRFPLLAVTLIRPSETDRVGFKFEQEPQIDATPHYIGAPGERLCGLAEWCCTQGETRWQFVVISTANAPIPGHKPTGNLIFLRVLWNGAGTYGVRADQVKNEHAPVTALCQYGPDSLVYCCGNDIWMRTFLFNERIFDRKMLASLNSAGVYITARPPFVYVTTKEHSVCVFKFENQILVPFVADSLAREGLAHLSLPERGLLLLTDKQGSLAALRLPDNGGSRTGLVTAFEATLPSSITRICNAPIRPPWKETHIQGVLERDLLGTATDGSLFSFSILNEASWRLLRFIQNMCMRHEQICEFTPRAYEEAHLEPQSRYASDFHVDGDILARLVEEEDAKQLLNDMLDVIPFDDTDNGTRVDYDSVDRRQTRFKELVDEVRNGPVADTSTAIDPNRDGLNSTSSDAVGFALRYIEAVIDSPF